MLHDAFGINEAVRGQADWLARAGYLALSADLGFWGRPSACLLRMFRDLRAGRGQTFDHVDAARTWLAASPAVAAGSASSGSAPPAVSPC